MASIIGGSRLRGPGLSGPGLGTLRAELANSPREVSSWQVAMRSFPPRMWSFGNPGGINVGTKSEADERAWRSVPYMWTKDPAFQAEGLWPVGAPAAIRGYIDRLLDEINRALYAGRGLPTLEAIPAGETSGQELLAEIPTSGLSTAQVQALRQAAGQGTVALTQAAAQLVGQTGTTPTSAGTQGRVAVDSELAGRAAQAAATLAADVMSVATSGGKTNAQLAAQILQGLVGAAVAVGSMLGPFAWVGYVCAAVFQIASWASGAWDHGVEPAEFAGYSYHWSDAQRKQVLRYRVLLQTCADRASLDKINLLPDLVSDQDPNSVRGWLNRTAYGMDGVNAHDYERGWTVKKMDRAVANAMALARQCGDQLADARLIKRICDYLRYVGASDKAIAMVDHWLWDSRRIERIHVARTTGEIDYASDGGYGSIRDIGLYPDYWRDWAYKGTGMTPQLFTRAHLQALHDYLRGRLVRHPVATIAAGQLDMARMAQNIRQATAARQQQQQRAAQGGFGTGTVLALIAAAGGGLYLLAQKR